MKGHQSVLRIAQRTPNLCWEACAKMLYLWKHRTDKGAEAKYEELAASYVKLNRALSLGDPVAVEFFHKLGAKRYKKVKIETLAVLLKTSPVVVGWTAETGGHAFVVIGSDAKQWAVINPMYDQTYSGGAIVIGKSDATSSMGEASGTWKVRTEMKDRKPFFDKLGVSLWAYHGNDG